MTKQIKHSGYQNWTCHKCQGLNTSRASKLKIFSTGRSRIQCLHCKGVFQMIKGEIKGEDIKQEISNRNELGRGGVRNIDNLGRVKNIDVNGSAEFTDPREGI
ncbi:hypothetical protein LCGC14_2266140 [marine sediment metagenome]|uniref:Uncharacterized protein n=1 Tax=marine sediment metagenome TaxID=412755 RepID=A0A0F9DKJ9_9ZZZZ